jgi:hypothetical protein
MRRLGLAALTVVILAGIGTGTYALVGHLEQEHQLTLVIGDAPAGEDTSSTPETSTGQAQTPLGALRPELYGLDVRQPFVDHDATKALSDPAFKIVTAWIAIGNRQDAPFTFKLSDLTLVDAYNHLAYNGSQPDGHDYNYTETVAPIWSPALEDQEIAPGKVVGGYVSWKVPWFVWPQEVFYDYPGPSGSGSGHGWGTPLFSDLNAGNRFYLAIGKLFYRGVVDGSKDEPFRPEDPITVAEFAKMIVLAAAPYNRADFSYPAGYIAEAARAGLVTWGAKTDSQALSRLEVALAVAQVGEKELSAPPAGYVLPFADVPESAKDALALLASNGVISGSTETGFNPTAECSRGQACRMLALLLDSRFRDEEKMMMAPLPAGMTTTTE